MFYRLTILAAAMGAASAYTYNCSNIQYTGPTNGRFPPICVDSIERGGLVWSDRSYGFVDAPNDFLHQQFTYYQTPLSNSQACQRGGGFRGRLNGSQPAQVGICCSQHQGTQLGPAQVTGVSSWTRLPGQFELSRHAGTPCGFYVATMQPGVEANICCGQGANTWSTGLFVSTVPPPATTTMPTTTGPFSDVNDTFHRAFAEIDAVVNETAFNSAFRSEFSVLLSLVVATQEGVNADLSGQVARLNTTLVAQSTAASTQMSTMNDQLTAVSTLTGSISNAISRAAQAAPAWSPNQPNCASTGTCTGAVRSANRQMTVSQPDGTVAFETGTCGTVDLCAIVSALGALRS